MPSRPHPLSCAARAAGRRSGGPDKTDGDETSRPIADTSRGTDHRNQTETLLTGPDKNFQIPDLAQGFRSMLVSQIFFLSCRSPIEYPLDTLPLSLNAAQLKEQKEIHGQ